ncbi:dihydroneopterin aldolase [Candidatus Foliamicus sp.]
MATDKLIVKDLRLSATVGVNRWEKAAPQMVAIDLEIGIEAAAAAGKDRISATVDYKRVARDIARLTSSKTFELVETLAEGIAALVLNDHSAPWVRVTVRKPWALRHARDVGVVIEREK